jgi:hypothetical protein
VDCVNSNSDFFSRIYVPLQVKPRLIRKECQLQIDFTFDGRLETKCNWIARLQGVRGLLLVLWGLSVSNFVALLAQDFDTPVS